MAGRSQLVSAWVGNFMMNAGAIAQLRHNAIVVAAKTGSENARRSSFRKSDGGIVVPIHCIGELLDRRQSSAAELEPHKGLCAP
jgi:hypothetical protein